MKILVAYDGTLSAKDVLRHGLKKIQDKGDEIIILHVFNRDLLQYYDATPQVEDKVRSDFNQTVADAEAIIRQQGNGVRASIMQFDGNPAREILGYAEKEKVDMILYPKTFNSLVKKYSAIMRENGIAVTPTVLQVVQQCAK